MKSLRDRVNDATLKMLEKDTEARRGDHRFDPFAEGPLARLLKERRVTMLREPMTAEVLPVMEGPPFPDWRTIRFTQPVRIRILTENFQ